MRPPESRRLLLGFDNTAFRVEPLAIKDRKAHKERLKPIRVALCAVRWRPDTVRPSSVAHNSGRRNAPLLNEQLAAAAKKRFDQLLERVIDGPRRDLGSAKPALLAVIVEALLAHRVSARDRQYRGAHVAAHKLEANGAGMALELCREE
jgi:hypothetical protein